MATMDLVIQHGNVQFTPPIIDDVKIEWERVGVPGKMVFTTIKMRDEEMSFVEGDPVCFYYDGKPMFKGYVFTKKREREHHITVTCYDQLRYLKNKFAYVFEKKTATQIIKAICDDFKIAYDNLANTNYVIPTLAEENKSLIDISINALEETLVNTGDMFVIYDDFGKIQLKNVNSMVSNTLICEDTAENIDYTSSIDDETYNNIVLYYDPEAPKPTYGGGLISGNTSSSQVSRILEMARSQIGTAENPLGSNNVKYNTEYYGYEVNDSYHAWCCVFVWWVFKQCGLPNLFCGGEKVNWCSTAMQYYRSIDRWYTKDYRPGDIIFFSWNGTGIDHVGIVESVDGNKVTCIEGNYGDKVARVVRTSCIVGVGRPPYSTVATRNASSSTSTTSSSSSSASSGKADVQIFTASNSDKIKEWGYLRYFERVDNPSIGQSKADALLKLYCRKTRKLKVTGAFGDVTVRGGTLIPVKLYLGDITANNYMLVDKVTHTFSDDHHKMDLTLEGAWDA